MSKDFVDAEKECGIDCKGTNGMGAWAGEMWIGKKDEESGEPAESDKEL